MIRNYIKTAFRSLWRSKATATINISGLTLGIASSLILFLMLKHTISFDNYHSKRDRIYRVTSQSKGTKGLDYGAGVPTVLPDAFKNDFPEAEEVVFTSYRGGDLITIPQKDGDVKRFSGENGVVFTQSNFFKVFDRKIVIGSAEKGLDDPNEAIISKKSALHFFGKEDVVGETLIHENIEYKITAVMEDYPSNTDFPFHLMLSYSTIKAEHEKEGWSSIWSDEQCYFLLKEGENIASIEARIPAFYNKYHEENKDEATYNMQPLSTLHSDDRYNNYTYNTTPKSVMVTMGVIALFLVVTACINFINLTTAEAIKRSKEVGVRKSLGSSRGQLILQFLGETSLVTIISVLLALGVAQTALGWLNPFLEQSLTLGLGSDYSVWIFLMTIIVVVSTLSGLYPSFVVSAFNPVLALKNLVSNKNSSGYALRRSLVVLQFFISQFFIIGTIVMIQQMDYFQKKNLGFDKDAILTVPIPVNEKPLKGNDGVSSMRTLKNEMLTIPGVEKASLSNTPPSSGSVSSTGFKIEGNEEDYGTQVKYVDGDYIDLFKLKLVSGKNIADLDTITGYLVNEKLAHTVGFKTNDEIVGKVLSMNGRSYPVVGVIEDFHTVSLHSEISPVILTNRVRGYQNLSLKLKTQDMQAAIAQIQQKWEKAYPEFIFSYEFLDENIKSFYDGTRKMSTLISIFTSLAIFIGCLGLFGLATFMANQKTKEIGVRKVLGATVESIVFLFSKEFIKLIVIGFALAAPAAWFIMTKYLEQFAYKIDIGPTIFLAGVGITFCIAILTVGYRSFKAATVNPAKSLRSE